MSDEIAYTVVSDRENDTVAQLEYPSGEYSQPEAETALREMLESLSTDQ